MFKKQYSCLIILILAALTSLPVRASNSCHDHLERSLKPQAGETSEKKLNDIMEDYFQKQTSIKTNSDYYDVMRYEKNEFYPSLVAFFKKSGIKIHRNETSTKGIDILSQGDHPLNRLAEKLAKRDIQLKFTPRYMINGSLGSFDGRNIHVDIQTISEGKPSFIILHEIRHAYNAARSQKFLYERLFQTKLAADEKSLIIPGMNQDPAYREYFSLDEILAHRQSASILLAEFHRTTTSEAKKKELATHLKKHGIRIRNFVEAWLTSEAGISKALSVGAVEFESLLTDNGRLKRELNWTITNNKPSSKENGFTLQEGLSVSLEITDAENFKFLNNKDAMLAFALRRITTVTNEMKILRESANSLGNAALTFNGQDTTSLKIAFEDFHAILTERRNLLNGDMHNHQR